MLRYIICHSNWHSMNTTRHSVLGEDVKFIPFSYTIKLPPPCYARKIIVRDKQGKIIRSIATNPIVK